MDRIDELDDTALLKELGRRIAFLRVSARMKQENLSEKTGISRFALSRLENGAGGIRLESFLAVLRCLNVLNRLTTVLPEPALTPLQLAELEKKGLKHSVPKRVRTRRLSTARVWGDGKPLA